MASNEPIREDEGFLSLLKPVIDIAKNSFLPLSEILESYIKHLHSNEDISNVNFLHAATLVQNSANIYSKKVDLLCSAGQQFHDGLQKRKLPKKKNAEDENKDEEGQPNKKDKRNKKGPVTYMELYDNLYDLENICSDHNINHEPVEVTREIKQVVLNTSVKLIPKEGTTFTLMDVNGEEIGKKHEFRLNWRMSSDGTLIDDFDSENDEMLVIDDKHEDTIVGMSCHPDDDHDDHDNGADGSVGLLVNGSGGGVEDEPDIFEQPPSEQIVEKNMHNRPGNNVLNEEETAKLLWQPVPPIVPIEDLPANKKKILKIPELEDEQEDKKRKKKVELKNILNKYGIIYMMLTDQQNNEKYFNFDEDLLHFQSKEQHLKKQEIIRRRKLFNEMLTEEAKQDFCGDFLGFDDMGPDNVDDFAGFGDDNAEDDANGCVNNVQVDVPLPDNALFHPNAEDRVLDAETYEDEAHKALQLYRTQKKYHNDQLAELSKRVALWHQIINPKIEASARRAHYDIHEYGTRILDHFPKSKGKFTIPFAKVVTHEPPEEVTRYFLSALMLVSKFYDLWRVTIASSLLYVLLTGYNIQQFALRNQ